MRTNYVFEPEKTDSQNYYYFQNAFTKEELDYISRSVERIKFIDAVTTGDSSKDVRSSVIKWVPQTKEWEWLYKKLNDYAVHANSILWKFNLYSMPEMIQYTEYWASEGGHYTWHQDIGPDVLSLRKVSITVQLSDDDEYEGGELEFTQGGDNILTAPKGAGTVVIFPSYLMHRVKKVTKGTRKSFVIWVGGEHYK